MTPERGRATKYLKLDKKSVERGLLNMEHFIQKSARAVWYVQKVGSKGFMELDMNFINQRFYWIFQTKAKELNPLGQKNSFMEKFKYASLVIWLKLVIKKWKKSAKMKTVALST